MTRYIRGGATPSGIVERDAVVIRVGGTFDFPIGGKFYDKHGAPISLQGVVKLLSERYPQAGPPSAE